MKILGLDIGVASVKGVLVDSAFGRYEIQDYFECPIQDGRTPEQAAAQLVQSISKTPDRMVCSLPMGSVTFRNVQIPTKNKKAIRSAVAFELEDDLPFPIDSAVHDHSILSQEGHGTHVHIAATLQKTAEEYLGRLKSVGLDPDVLTTESWAYRVLFNRVLDRSLQEIPDILINIGHEFTSLYVHWRGFPVLSRRIHWGGKNLTQVIMRKYGLGETEAEKAKMDNGFVLSEEQRIDATPDQIEFSDLLEKNLDELVREVRQTMLSCKNVTHHGADGIFLSGKSSLLPGLAQLLERHFSIAVRPLDALSGLSTSGVNYSDETDASCGLAAALAMCLVGSDRGAVVNLRKGNLSKKEGAGAMQWDRLRVPAVSLGVSLLVVFVSLLIQSRIYRARIDRLDSELEKSMKGLFGYLSKSAAKTYLASPEKLRKKVSDKLAEHRAMVKLYDPNPRAPLDYLKILSKKIPKSTVVDLVRMEIGAHAERPFDPGGEITFDLTFVVANPQMAEKLNDHLSSLIRDLKRSNMEAVSGEDGQKWKVTFSGKTLEAWDGK